MEKQNNTTLILAQARMLALHEAGTMPYTSVRGVKSVIPLSLKVCQRGHADFGFLIYFIRMLLERHGSVMPEPH